jgi:hypothetical protein
MSNEWVTGFVYLAGKMSFPLPNIRQWSVQWNSNLRISGLQCPCKLSHSDIKMRNLIQIQKTIVDNPGNFCLSNTYFKCHWLFQIGDDVICQLN